MATSTTREKHARLASSIWSTMVAAKGKTSFLTKLSLSLLLSNACDGEAGSAFTFPLYARRSANACETVSSPFSKVTTCVFKSNSRSASSKKEESVVKRPKSSLSVSSSS